MQPDRPSTTNSPERADPPGPGRPPLLSAAEPDGLLLLDPARRFARPSKLKVVALAALVASVAAGALVWSNRRSPRELAAKFRSAAAISAGDGDLARAEEHLRAAIEAMPSDATLHAMLGDLLSALGREPEAMDAYAEAVALAPRHAGARTARARRRIAAGDGDGALAEIGAIGVIPPDEPGAELAAGDALLLTGEPAAALARYEAALAAPRGADVAVYAMKAAYVARFLARTTGDAEMLAAADRHGEAAATAALAAGRDDLHAEACLLIGRTQTAIRLLDERRIAARLPALAAAIELSDGQGALAEIRLRECIDGNAEPGIKASARAALVRVLACDGRAAAAVAEYRALAAADPGGADTAELRDAGEQASRALLAVTAADDLLVRAFAAPPAAYDPIYGDLAELVVRRGSSSAARRVRLAVTGPAALASGDAQALARLREDIDALLAAVPGDEIASAWSAALLLRAGEARAAVDLLDPLIGRRSTPAPLVVHALGLARLGRWAEVLDDCRVLGLSGDDSPVSAALAIDSHLALGEASAANAVATRAVLRWPGDPTVDSAWGRVLAAVAPADDGSDAARIRAVLARARDALRADPERRRAAVRELAIAALDDGLARERLLGVFDDAAAAWAEMERVNPDDPRPPIARAAFFTRAGRLQQAERLLRAASARMQDVGLRVEHARSLSRLGRHDEALGVLSACREHAVAPETVDLVVAEVQRSSGDARGAAATLRRVLTSAGPAPLVQAQAAVAIVTADQTSAQDRAAVGAWLASPAAAGLPTDTLVLVAAAHGLAGGDLRRSAELAEQVPRDSLRRSDAVLVQATALLAAGDPARAEAVVVERLAVTPSDQRLRSLASNARIALGLRSVAAGESAAAAAWFEAAILGSEADVVAAAVLADIVQRAGGAIAAGPVRGRLEAARSGSPGVPVFRGLLAAAAGDAGRARAEFAEAFRRAPGESAALALFARSCLAAGDPRAARDACERAIEAGERSGLAREILASIHRQATDLAGAEAQLRSALSQDPANAGALASLVEVLVARGDPDGARQAVRSAAPVGSGEPADREVQSRRMRMFVVAGPVGGAIDRCASVFAGDPVAWRAWQERARALLLTGDAAGAVPLLERAIALAPREFVPQAMLVRALADAGRIGEADEGLAARAAADPRDPVSRCLRGMIAEHGGRAEDAERHYRAALAADEDCALAANNLACLLVGRQGTRDEAKSLIARYALRFPGDPSLTASRAWVAMRAGAPAEAIGIAREGIARHPGHAGLHARLAEALFATGREAEARDALRTAATLDPEVVRSVDDALRRAAFDR